MTAHQSTPSCMTTATPRQVVRQVHIKSKTHSNSTITLLTYENVVELVARLVVQ